MIIGITGGTGAGKTTALKAIERLGGFIIDCDEVYHSLLKNSREMKEEINRRFPGVVSDDTVDTKKLGAIVFKSEESLRDLDNITHPHVVEETKRRIEKERQRGCGIFAIDAIGLFECGLGALCDVTVFVTAPREIRAKRIMNRENISMEYAMMRIDSQKKDEFFRKRCTYTLENNFDSEKSFSEYCYGFFNNIIRRD